MQACRRAGVEASKRPVGVVLAKAKDLHASPESLALAPRMQEPTGHAALGSAGVRSMPLDTASAATGRLGCLQVSCPASGSASNPAFPYLWSSLCLIRPVVAPLVQPPAPNQASASKACPVWLAGPPAQPDAAAGC